MQALWIEQFGQPESLRVQDIDMPEVCDGEALIEVHAAAVNPSDVKNAQGAMSHTTLPRILGRDYAGIVRRGPDAWQGRAVWGTGGDLGFTRHGTHAEFVTVPVESLREKPGCLTMAQAASVGVGYVTAWAGLIEKGRLQAGETVLVVGGSGAVGTAATQIARWAGATVIATLRQPEEAAPGWRANVDIVVDLHSEGLVEAVHAATGERGVDLVLNAVGGETFAPSAQSLAGHGRLVSISSVGDRQVSFDLLGFYRQEQEFFGLNTLLLDATACARMLEHLRPGFETGRLKVADPKEINLASAPSAYQEVDQGARNKVVLKMA